MIDTIGAFDQAAKFLSSIKTTAPIDHARLITHLSAIISNSLQYYANKIYEQSIQQSQQSAQEEESKFLSLFKPKAGTSTPFNLTSQSLVKLNNLLAMRKNVHQLYDSMEVEKIKDLLSENEPAKLSSDSSESADIASRKFAGTLNMVVVKAQGLKACDTNGKSDPYVLIYFQKKLVARTRIIDSMPPPPTAVFLSTGTNSSLFVETLNPKWNEKFELLISDTRELDILVYDHDVFSTDDLCGEAVLKLDKTLDSYNHDIWLNLLPQGRLLLRVKFEASEVQDIAFHFSFMFRFLKKQTADMIRLFTDQMTPYFSDTIGKIITEAGSKSFFGSSDTKEVSLVEAQQALQPLIKHLETNLALLSDKLYSDISQLLIKKIWKALIRCFKLVLLPSIEEDIMVSRTFFNKRAQLTSRQLSMILSSLQVLKEFFGVGLEAKALNNKRLTEMETAIGYYKKDAEQLIKVYMKLEKDVEKEKDEAKLKQIGEEQEVLLLILELKDTKDSKKFVEDMLKQLELERKHQGNMQTSKD